MIVAQVSKVIFIASLFFSTRIYACESDESKSDQFQVWAELRDKKEWCVDKDERALPVFIGFPKIYDGVEVNKEVTLIVSSEHVELFTILTRAPHLGGVSFCINQELLKYTKVFLSYGYTKCKVPKKGFSFTNLEALLDNGKIYPSREN